MLGLIRIVMNAAFAAGVGAVVARTILGDKVYKQTIGRNADTATNVADAILTEMRECINKGGESLRGFYKKIGEAFREAHMESGKRLAEALIPKLEEEIANLETRQSLSLSRIDGFEADLLQVRREGNAEEEAEIARILRDNRAELGSIQVDLANTRVLLKKMGALLKEEAETAEVPEA